MQPDGLPGGAAALARDDHPGLEGDAALVVDLGVFVAARHEAHLQIHVPNGVVARETENLAKAGESLLLASARQEGATEIAPRGGTGRGSVHGPPQESLGLGRISDGHERGPQVGEPVGARHCRSAGRGAEPGRPPSPRPSRSSDSQSVRRFGVGGILAQRLRERLGGLLVGW